MGNRDADLILGQDVNFDDTIQLCYTAHNDLRTLRNVSETAKRCLISRADELQSEFQALEIEEHRQIWISEGLIEYEKQLRDAAQHAQARYNAALSGQQLELFRG